MKTLKYKDKNGEYQTITPIVINQGGSSLPEDGEVGQVLTKTEDGAEWKNIDIEEEYYIKYDASSGIDFGANTSQGLLATLEQIKNMPYQTNVTDWSKVDKVRIIVTTNTEGTEFALINNDLYLNGSANTSDEQTYVYSGICNVSIMISSQVVYGTLFISNNEVDINFVEANYIDRLEYAKHKEVITDIGVGISTVTYVKDGSTKSITVPYATKAGSANTATTADTAYKASGLTNSFYNSMYEMAIDSISLQNRLYNVQLRSNSSLKVVKDLENDEGRDTTLMIHNDSSSRSDIVITIPGTLLSFSGDTITIPYNRYAEINILCVDGNYFLRADVIS